MPDTPGDTGPRFAARRGLGGLAVGAGVLAVLSSTWLLASASQQTSTTTRTPPAQPARPPDQLAFNKALAVKDPADQIAAIIAYAEEFPDSETVYFAAARGMHTLADADQNDTTRLRPFILNIEDVMAKAAVPYRRADVYYTIAYRLVNRRLLIPDALRLAEKSVPLLNEQEYIDIRHKAHDAREAALTTRTPTRTPEPFQVAEAVDEFRGVRANHLSTLGRAYLLADRPADAETALLASYDLLPVMETGMALADMREKAGKDAEALEFALAAELTGKMTSVERATLDRLFAKVHGGSTADLVATLDARFRASHPNPVSAAPYVPTPQRTGRVALAELFTGQACIPCISVDLSIEAALERYTRKDVALLVYHIHAPEPDPLSNMSVEDRCHYYTLNYAPTVYLDGHKGETGEGGPTFALQVSRTLDELIESRLDSPADADLAVTASLSGSVVHASVTGRGIATLHRTVRLQIALVEIEVSYSGANGLHFQPMVVRDLAGGGPAKGFIVSSGAPMTTSVDFDLPAITADNLAYYDWYRADLKKRTNGAVEGSFRDQKHVMDPAKLAVVAFLQDEKTKAVLQAAYVVVTPSR
jgi:hypothetical protein